MIGGADRIFTVNQRRRYNGQISSNGDVRAGTGGSGPSVEINACLTHPIRTEEQSKAESHQEDWTNIAMTSDQRFPGKLLSAYRVNSNRPI